MTELRRDANAGDDRLRRHLDPDLERIRWLGTVDREDLEALAACPRLTGLALIASGLDDTALAPLFGSPLLARLVELDLTYGSLGDDGLAALVGSPACAGLRGLAVGINQLTDRAIDAIVASPYLGGLERLSLGDGFLDQPFASPFGEKLTVLEQPYLASYRFAEQRAPRPNAITAAGIARLGAATNLPALRELGLWALPIGPVGVVALAGSTLFPRLTALDLRFVTIRDAGEAALRAALPGAALEGIALTRADVPMAGLLVTAAIPRVVERCTRVAIHVRVPDERLDEVLGALGGLHRVTSLDLPQPFTGVGAAAFRALVARLPLRELGAYAYARDAPALLATLGGHALARLHLTLCDPGTADAATQLAAWPGLATLADLAVRGAIADAGAAALLGSPHLRATTRLAFEGCGLTDRTVDALLASPRLDQLALLDLRDNRLTLAGLTALVDAIATRMPALTQLELYGNPVGWENVEWHDWDGSVVGGGLEVAPALREVMQRVPSRVRIHHWDPR